MHELSCTLAAEQTILNILPQLEHNCQTQQIKQALNHHITETQRQVSRCQEVCRQMGFQPLSVTDNAVDCMQQDFQQFLQQNPNQECMDLFCVGAFCKTEYYEVATYRGLVEKCSAMGESQCASLLEDSLREEESMARQLEQIGKQLGSLLIHRTTP